MDKKKIGIWAGGFLGSFIIMLVLAYFLYPFINPKKAKKVKQKQQESKMKHASYAPDKYNLHAVDSLNDRIKIEQTLVDSLKKKSGRQRQVIDSLNNLMKKVKASMKGKAEKAHNDSAAVKKASQSLLRLDKNSLGPIINLLGDDKLVSLYDKANSRQREKLLKALQPKKAAEILKKVM